MFQQTLVPGGRVTRELRVSNQAEGSWDKKLFPDHVKFLKDLHDRGLKVSLNVHPADGVRSFETAYSDMCKAMNRDSSKQVVGAGRCQRRLTPARSV
jgi:hypothetical protein